MVVARKDLSGDVIFEQRLREAKQGMGGLGIQERALQVEGMLSTKAQGQACVECTTRIDPARLASVGPDCA